MKPFGRSCPSLLNELTLSPILISLGNYKLVASETLILAVLFPTQLRATPYCIYQSQASVSGTIVTFALLANNIQAKYLEFITSTALHLYHAFREPKIRDGGQEVIEFMSFLHSFVVGSLRRLKERPNVQG